MICVNEQSPTLLTDFCLPVFHTRWQIPRERKRLTTNTIICWWWWWLTVMKKVMIFENKKEIWIFCWKSSQRFVEFVYFIVTRTSKRRFFLLSVLMIIFWAYCLSVKLVKIDVKLVNVLTRFLWTNAIFECCLSFCLSLLVEK